MRNGKRIVSAMLLLAVFVSGAVAISEGEIQRVAQVMAWRSDQVIADVGAGEGEIGFTAVGKVGESVKVYLTELDEEKFGLKVGHYMSLPERGRRCLNTRNV